MEVKKCIDCNVEKQIDSFMYKKRKSRNGLSISLKCQECNKITISANKKLYYEGHKEHHRVYNSNPDNKKRRNLRKKERKEREPQFKTIESLKARTHEVLRRYKGCSSSSLLNCTREQLYEWLQFQFTDDMNWENYGKVWHIDHVVPISFFDNTKKEEQLLCFNWTNLKPLHSAKNMSKSSKIDKEYILEHYKLTSKFCKDNQRYQTGIERCLWQRMELWYGNNSQDDIAFEMQLKRAIRIQDPKFVNDENMDKVQRLNGYGLETANPCQ